MSSSDGTIRDRRRDRDDDDGRCDDGDGGDDVGDLLVPPFDSIGRESHTVVATFNLIASIVGGGVLSLPLAFRKLGIGTATILMILSAFLTDRTLYLLCVNARLTGASSYGEIGRMAFGPWMETFVTVLIFVLLMFVIVAYMVLLRDIWTPLAKQAAAALLSPRNNNGGGGDDGSHDDDTDAGGNYVLLGIVVLSSPFLVQRNLHALRYNCFVGFASVSILCVALVRHGLFRPATTTATASSSSSSTTNATSSSSSPSLLYFTDDADDALFAFPIIMLSFLSHFNILPIQNALVRPTRRRVGNVVRGAVASCLVLMFLFGWGGYAYAGDDTEGNILLNIGSVTTSTTTTAGSGDWMFALGRVGCGISIMVATCIMTLPCRENLLEVIDMMTGAEGRVDVTTIGEQTALLRREPVQKDPVFVHPALHYGSTAAIALVCYAFAAAVPGVAVVWSLCGSCMAFLIAFLLPAAFYVRVQSRERRETENKLWMYFSWIVLVLSGAGAVACTANTAYLLSRA